jgi:hypothetical protein
LTLEVGDAEPISRWAGSEKSFFFSMSSMMR